MNSRYYYAFDDTLPERAVNACSRESFEYPLTVNCAGNIVTASPFATDNARGREDYYLIYVVSGSMDVSLGGEVRHATVGDIILFPPRCHYKYVYRGETQLSYLWVHFTGSYAAQLLEECGFGSLPCLHAASDNSKISAGFDKIFEMFETGSRLRRHELACALERLLLTAALSLDSHDDTRTLERSLAYIHSAYSTDIRIPDLARMENLSNSRYVALFGKRIGTSPSAYIINLRMNAACDLLRNTDMSIKQISVLVGYPDAHFFSRLFKKHTSSSPQAYRRSNNA